jgi:hypothetical protein
MVRLNIRPWQGNDMQLISDDARRYLLHQRLARRWIRDGGVVIASESAPGGRSTFDFVETIVSGATLQVTYNLREVSKACRFLSDYAVYLWDCEHEGEYLLCGLDKPFSAGNARPYRSVPAACYAGRFPKLRLEIHDAQVGKPSMSRTSLMTRILLPRGLCAAIHQMPSDTSAICAGMPSLRAALPRTMQTIAEDA